MDPLKNQTTAARADDARRWWVLATVVAAQFIYGCDAFIVNVAIPTIARELTASEAQIEAVVAVYFIGYATLVITGGRLGDIFGTRNVFVAGVLGFALTSLWCGLARSGAELVAARLAQGSCAALMVPQVLATIHVLFNDDARPRAFSIYGIVLGLAGASGFAIGGLLLQYDPFGIGWRGVFVVNVPIGFAIAAAAWWLMPPDAAQSGGASRQHRRVHDLSRAARPDWTAAVRARSGLVAVDLAGDGGGRGDRRDLPGA